ncbi:hypothetical protein ACMHYB_33945 [Sorangium sp. So ce1128]
MTRWEYLNGDMPTLRDQLAADASTTDVLRVAGLAGWELVQVCEVGGGRWHFFFKRPLQEPAR